MACTYLSAQNDVDLLIWTQSISAAFVLNQPYNNYLQLIKKQIGKLNGVVLRLSEPRCLLIWNI